MSGAYATKFTGEIELIPDIDTIGLDNIKRVINETFKDVMSLDENTKTIYICGDYDDTHEYVEKFICKLTGVILITSDAVIKAQGEDPKDRYDIVIRKDGVFVQEYKLAKGLLKKFVAMG